MCQTSETYYRLKLLAWELFEGGGTCTVFNLQRTETAFWFHFGFRYFQELELFLYTWTLNIAGLVDANDSSNIS